MDRSARLLNLAYQLGQAAVERDWSTVARVDADIAAMLPRLAALGAWAHNEARALATLRETHRVALEYCEREAAEVDARMAALCTHRDGWAAYAMEDDSYLEGRA
ncbi:MAG: hypothetical protein QM639_13015 [Rhodocyclaceae bacterium]